MRRINLFSQRLALLAMLGAPIAACSKKEEPAPAAKTPEAAPSADSEKPADAANKPAEPSKLDEKKAAEVVKAAGEVAAIAGGDFSLLKSNVVAALPAGVFGVIGTPNLSELVNSFVAIGRAAGVPVPPDPIGMTIAQLEGSLGIKLDWLDVTKPVRIVSLNHGAGRDGFILLAEIKAGSTSFDASKLPGAQAETEGHLAKLIVEGQTLYIDRDGDLLIVSTHNNLKTSQADFIKSLSAWIPGAPLVIDSSLSNVRGTFDAEIKQAEQMADAIAQQDPDMGADAKAGFDLIFSFINQAKRGQIALDLRGEHARLLFSFEAEDGSEAGKYLTSLKGFNSKLGANIPADAWLAVAQAAPKTDSALAEKYFLASFKDEEVFGKLSEADLEILRGHYREMLAQSGTDSAAWIQANASSPFEFSGISTAEDGQKALNAILAFGEFAFSKALEQQRKSNPEIPANLTLKSLVELLNTTPDSPVKAELLETASKAGAPAKGLILKPVWSMMTEDADIQLVKQLFGNEISVSAYGHEKLLAAAMGANANARAIQLVEDGIKSSALNPTAAQLTAEYGGYGFIYPIRLLKALSPAIPEVAAKEAKFSQIKDLPLTFGMSGETNTIHFQMSFPNDFSKLIMILED